MALIPSFIATSTPSPPLGLAFLAGALERAGVEVKILDLVVFPYSKKMLESVLKGFLPHIVGITAVTMTFDNALDVIKDVKSIDPDIITVMGGPHVTFCAGDTMNSFPALDFLMPADKKAPLRICLLSYRSNPHCGGQGVYLKNLSRALKELGHLVEVVSGPPDPLLDGGITVFRLPCLDLYDPENPFRTPTMRELSDPINLMEWLGVSTAGCTRSREQQRSTTETPWINSFAFNRTGRGHGTVPPCPLCQ